MRGSSLAVVDIADMPRCLCILIIILPGVIDERKSAERDIARLSLVQWRKRYIDGSSLSWLELKAEKCDCSDMWLYPRP